MNVNKAQGWEKRGRHSVLVKIMQFLNGYRNLKIWELPYSLNTLGFDHSVV